MKTIINIDAAETQLKAIHTDQTGGNIYNDVIELKNGYIIRISSEGLSVYKNEDDDENGIDVCHTEFTQPDFINPILAEEKKDFPKNIEVTIEASNNPHGNYELTVVANDEVLAHYWYNTKEDAQQDADKLEDSFEVTFI